MSDASPRDRPAAGRGRRTLLLIGAVGLAPIVASLAVYYFFPRRAETNYGKLLPTAPAPAIDGATIEGTPFRLAELRGRWVLLAADPAGCAAACAGALHATRQAQAMQGRDRERVVRVWLDAGGAPPPPELRAQHPGLIVARVSAALLAALPGGPSGIWLVDPLGNLVLSYSSDPDIKGLANDLARVLRASSIG